MKITGLVVAAVLLSSCAAKLPTEPSSLQTQRPTAGVPSRIELNANPEFGDKAGTGTINARVLDAYATALAGQTVTFTASQGTVTPGQVVTDDKGFARAAITAPAGEGVTVVAAAGTVEQKTVIAMQLPSPAPIPPGEPPAAQPPPPPPPPPPLPTPIYGVVVTATPASVLIGRSVTLTAVATPFNNAPVTPASFTFDCDGNGTIDASGPAATAVCTFPTVGTFTARATATNGVATGSGTTSIAAVVPTITVSCDSPTLKPATTVPPITPASATATCVVNAKIGADPVFTSEITSVEFDWGDNSARTTVATNFASHVYGAALTLPVIATATVSGVAGIRGTGSVTVKP